MERAGFGIRLGAFVLDGIIFGIVSWVVGFLLGFVIETNPIDPETGMPVWGPGTWVSLLVSLVLFFIYYVWIPFRTNGQTFGKKVTGIRVARVNDEPLTMVTLFVREFIGKTLSSMTLLIGYLVALGSQKRALHDYIAGTVVERV